MKDKFEQWAYGSRQTNQVAGISSGSLRRPIVLICFSFSFLSGRFSGFLKIEI